MYSFENDIKTVLADEAKLAEICDRLAREITATYENSGRDLIFVTVLKGSVFFATDLIRRIPLKCELEFMKVSSYGAGTESTGKVSIKLDMIRDDIDRCDILIIEDIIDSGITLYNLTRYLKEKGAKSVRTCTLLDKPSRRRVEFSADYVGCEVPDEFVVGYGLDYDEMYRALPFVGVLKPEVYAN